MAGSKRRRIVVAQIDVDVDAQYVDEVCAWMEKQMKNLKQGLAKRGMVRTITEVYLQPVGPVKEKR